jgi:NAD-dependent dihydropyrimidine dehydrogenase PreA subunit
MPALVDPEKCEGCGDCIPACPNESIKMTEANKALVDKEMCIDCRACVDTCTKFAIDMVD